jgi:hypothetical protein
MGHLNTPWTDEDNDRLKALVAQGVSIARAAVTFKRSIMAVRHQARKLGTPFPKTHEVRRKLADALSGSRP